MFDVSKVNSSLFGEVGFQQPIDPDYDIVDSANQEARSGRYFTDNSFVKIRSIKDTQDYSDISDSEFNNVLENIQNRSITAILDKIFDEPDFIDRQVLYKYANNKINTEVLPDGFVGYEINQSIAKNLTFEIKRVILEFQGTGDITLLLYNSAKNEPIKTQLVSVTSSLQEVELNWKIDNSDTYYKGKYFLGYLTDGVTILPYDRDYENAKIPSNLEGLCFNPISVTYSPITNELFDLDDINNVSETWGLNPDIVVYDDFTDFIIQNRRLFSPSIQLQGQITCIQQYISAIRSNINERYSKEFVNNAIFEIEGIQTESLKKQGLKTLLSIEISRLKKEIRRMQNGYLSKGFISVTRS